MAAIETHFAYIKLMDWVHVRSEISRSSHFGERASEELVIVQVVDDEEESLEASVGLSEKVGVTHQFRDGDIGELGEKLLQLRVGLEVPKLD